MIGILLHQMKWDVILFLRYQIITVAGIITILYSFIFQLLPQNSDAFLIIIIFSDPTFLGFLFIGAIVLYEKSANTIQALSVTPFPISVYIISKALVLAVIAILAGFVIAFAGKGVSFHPGFLFLAVFLTSILFILLGMVGVSHVQTFNQYLLVIPLFFIPAVLPLLELLGFIRSPVLYLVPTRASLLLFEAAFRYVAKADLVYAILYLIIWIIGCYKWACHSMLNNWKNE